MSDVTTESAVTENTTLPPPTTGDVKQSHSKQEKKQKTTQEQMADEGVTLFRQGEETTESGIFTCAKGVFLIFQAYGIENGEGLMPASLHTFLKRRMRNMTDGTAYKWLLINRREKFLRLLMAKSGMPPFWTALHKIASHIRQEQEEAFLEACKNKLSYEMKGKELDALISSVAPPPTNPKLPKDTVNDLVAQKKYGVKKFDDLTIFEQDKVKEFVMFLESVSQQQGGKSYLKLNEKDAATAWSLAEKLTAKPEPVPAPQATPAPPADKSGIPDPVTGLTVTHKAGAPLDNALAALSAVQGKEPETPAPSINTAPVGDVVEQEEEEDEAPSFDDNILDYDPAELVKLGLKQMAVEKEFHKALMNLGCHKVRVTVHLEQLS